MAKTGRAKARKRYLEALANLRNAGDQASWNAYAEIVNKLGQKWKFEGYETATQGGYKPPKTQAEYVKESTPVVSGAIDEASKITDKLLPVGSFGRVEEKTSQETQDLLDLLRQRADEAAQYTGREEQSLRELESGLQGYAAPEVQAMREAAMQEINRQYQTQLAQQQRLQARSGVRGGAAMGGMQDLQMNAQQAGGNLERDLVIQNANEIQKRREAFATMVNNVEAARFGRSATFTGMYGTAASNEEAARRNREAFNVNAGTNENLTRAATTTGTAGTILGQGGASQNYDITSDWNNFVQQYMQSQSDLAAQNAAALRRDLNT